ncbi:MAG: OmpP1/FadL family transporter [Endozoicomonas sp.]
MRRITSPLLALSTLAMAVQAGAAGFALNESTASAAGTAYAGRASNVEDASIMAANPAGIALLEHTEVTVGGAYVAPKGKFEGTGTPGGATKEDDFLKSAAVPFGYFSTPINDKLSMGLGIYAPFGATSDYDKNWAGRYMANKTVVKVVNVQPTIAYQFTDELSVGLGVFGSYAEGELTRSLPVFHPNNPQIQLPDGFSEMKGDDWGYGWTLGAIWQPTAMTSVGLSYRSQIKLSLEGEAKVTLPTPRVLTEKAKLDITLPEQVELSLTHQIDDRWTVMTGATWTRWSRFKELVIETNQGGGPVSGLDPSNTNVLTYVPENWKDVWAFSLGTSYKYNDKLTLKAGYAFDQSPVKDEFRTARIPDSDRNWLTIGAKYDVDQDWTVDAAYGYMFAADSKIDEKGHLSNGTPNGSTLKGEYETAAHVFSVSVTRRF